jgi:serine/threonine-protein kinase RIO1
MIGKMTEITVSDKNNFNIWPYISKLKAAKILSHKIKEPQLVHKIYRNSTEDFEHILLSTEKENHFVVIVANRNKKKTIGYFLHDLNGLYS